MKLTENLIKLEKSELFINIYAEALKNLGWHIQSIEQIKYDRRDGYYFSFKTDIQIDNELHQNEFAEYTIYCDAVNVMFVLNNNGYDQILNSVREFQALLFV